MKIRVKLKNPARRKSLMECEIELPDSVSTLRELLISLVQFQVGEFNAKKVDVPLPLFLTEDELREQAGRVGKIGFGARYDERAADPAGAVKVALSAFEDGLFRVFSGMDELTALDAPLRLEEEAEIMIIKLAMLAGRMY